MRAILAALFAAASASHAHAEEIWVTIDQVRPYEIEKPAGQIVIGNPAIADVSVQDKTRVLLYGKTPGVTNMYIFDDDGSVIDNLMVRVRSSTDMLTMHRGALRATYNCSSRCELAPTIGDNKDVFTDINSQVQLKTTQMTSGGPTTGGQ